MAKTSSTVKAIGGAPKVKLPTAKMATPKAPQLANTGLGGYLQASKIAKTPKPPKNGLNASAISMS